MAARRSAGILLYRDTGGGLEVLLVHPGGPLWARRDEGAWSIPKGEYEPGEDARAAALREFEEELGRALPAAAQARLIDLGSVRQPGGKLVTAWAARGDLEPAAICGNTFELEWPPRSGNLRQFPEVDRAGWFAPAEARVKLLRGQLPLLDALLRALSQNTKP